MCPDDVRMHYTVAELPGPANVVPVKSVGKFSPALFLKGRVKGCCAVLRTLLRAQH